MLTTEQLIEKYYLVSYKLAHRLQKRFPNIPEDVLESIALEKLYKCAEAFNPKYKNHFLSFLFHCIFLHASKEQGRLKWRTEKTTTIPPVLVDDIKIAEDAITFNFALQKLKSTLTIRQQEIFQTLMDSDGERGTSKKHLQISRNSLWESRKRICLKLEKILKQLGLYGYSLEAK